jgi:hypothetical protein
MIDIQVHTSYIAMYDTHIGFSIYRVHDGFWVMFYNETESYTLVVRDSEPSFDDAGTPPDEKSSFDDAGTPPDEKSSFDDAGTPPSDEKSSFDDAGTPPSDEKSSFDDAGTPPSDEKSSFDDAGTPPSDEKSSFIVSLDESFAKDGAMVASGRQYRKFINNIDIPYYLDKLMKLLTDAIPDIVEFSEHRRGKGMCPRLHKFVNDLFTKHVADDGTGDSGIDHTALFKLKFAD